MACSVAAHSQTNIFMPEQFRLNRSGALYHGLKPHSTVSRFSSSVGQSATGSVNHSSASMACNVYSKSGTSYPNALNILIGVLDARTSSLVYVYSSTSMPAFFRTIKFLEVPFSTSILLCKDISQILVLERKERCLERVKTTEARKQLIS